MGVDVEAALNGWRRSRSRCTAGRGTTSAGSRARARRSAAAWRSPGNYPGKARTPDELRSDLDKALSLIPGTHRLNLHASYAETGGKQGRARRAPSPSTSSGWIDWAKVAADRDGLQPDVSSPTRWPPTASPWPIPTTAIRRFWIDHGIACRRIGAAIGKALGSPCITNVWIPDGSKDTPVDRKGPRERLAESLDAIFAEPIDPRLQPRRRRGQALRPRLGVLRRRLARVLPRLRHHAQEAPLPRRRPLPPDRGRSPTRSRPCCLYLDEILLHVSRGVRWDSDHVVILTDELQAIAQELVRGDYLGRVHIGLDFFDASINRVAAWVIGTRAMLKALLLALLEPTETLRRLEAEGDYTARLALLEELKALPFGAVWDHYCLHAGRARRAATGWPRSRRTSATCCRSVADRRSGRRQVRSRLTHASDSP